MTAHRIFSFLGFMIAVGILTAGMSSPSSAQNVYAQPTALMSGFRPMGVWDVKKTALSEARGLSNIQLPCVMMTTYDNGYIVRFSGGGNKLLAMAIDFRQNVFRQGRKYPVTINLGSGSQTTQATAFSESTLIFNLRHMGSFYQQLQASPTMRLDIEGNNLNFNMGNFGEALNQLEQCFNPGAKPVAPTQAAGNWDEKVSPMPDSAAKAQPVPSINTSMRWEAKAGDDLRQTLQSWSRRAGVQLDWQADTNGRVVGDIQVNGTFEDAVQALMAQNSAALGVDASLMTASTPQNIMPAPSAPLSSRPTQVSAGMAAGGAYSAAAGSSLQAVLQNWSDREGVDFLWQSHEGFKVKQAVSGASYEVALRAVLEQYTNDKLRPAAQLNNDPETGQRLLIVDSTRVR